MASTISAGTSLITSLVMTGDTSGALQLITNGTTALTVDTSQNVTFANTATISTIGSAAATALVLKSAGTTALTVDTSQNVTFAGTATVNTIGSAAATALTLKSAGTTAVTVDTSQRVGIGTTSPGANLEVKGASGQNIYVSYTSGSQLRLKSDSGDSGVGTTGSTPLLFLINNGEVARFDSSGNLGIGTTSPTSLLQTAGSSSKTAFKTPNMVEVDTISATAATGTINYDVATQSVLYYTSNASANWTLNFRGSSGTSLNTLMQTGESISATFLVTQGSTAYYNSAVTIDGASVTPKWQGGSAPTSGNASSTDCYTYVLQKTGSATYVVLASQTKFA